MEWNFFPPICTTMSGARLITRSFIATRDGNANLRRVYCIYIPSIRDRSNDWRSIFRCTLRFRRLSGIISVQGRLLSEKILKSKRLLSEILIGTVFGTWESYARLEGWIWTVFLENILRGDYKQGKDSLLLCYYTWVEVVKNIINILIFRSYK